MSSDTRHIQLITRTASMPKNSADTIINLIAVIVAVTNDTPRVLIVDQNLSDASGVLPSDVDPLSGSGRFSLPNGPFEPRHHPSLESGLRSWVAAQTGLDLYYVEQLYTFWQSLSRPWRDQGWPKSCIDRIHRPDTRRRRRQGESTLAGLVQLPAVGRLALRTTDFRGRAYQAGIGMLGERTAKPEPAKTAAGTSQCDLWSERGV